VDWDSHPEELLIRMADERERGGGNVTGPPPGVNTRNEWVGVFRRMVVVDGTRKAEASHD